MEGVNTSDGERRGGGGCGVGEEGVGGSGSGRRRMEEDGVKKKKEWLAAETRPQR